MTTKSSGRVPRLNRFLPHLFERLQDQAPSQQSEAPEAYTLTRSAFRQRVLYDLETLLNTVNHQDWLDGVRYPHAAESTINFGMPPLAGAFLSEHQWRTLELAMRKAIVRFEPRLVPASLVIRPLLKDETHADYNVVVFELSGEIVMQPYPLAFTVQSAIDLETRRVEFRSNDLDEAAR